MARIDTRAPCGPMVVNCIGSDLIPSPNPIFGPSVSAVGKAWANQLVPQYIRPSQALSFVSICLGGRTGIPSTCSLLG